MSLSFSCTRLAPSPTGSLHLGHAQTFLITWWLARAAGARVIFRMEDLDSRRAKPQSVQLTYDDLRWLGIDWDAGPPESRAGFAAAPASAGETREPTEYVQSRRRALYEDALDRLWQGGSIYPCTCSRAEIAASVAASAGAPQEGDVQVRYPGTCRPGQDDAGRRFSAQPNRHTRADVEARLRAASGKPVCWRFAVPEETIHFEDAVHGGQSWQVSADSGDFPVTRFDGTPAYQLAVVVDDADMHIDCVIRGDDLLSSTPRQMLIYRALERPVPEFIHTPLVVGTDGKRIAKRHGESRIAQFRDRGVPPERIVGWVAWRTGQIERPREIAARELISHFDLTRMTKDRVVMTQTDLDWLDCA